MNISILTMFPKLYGPFWETSLLAKAEEKSILSHDVKGFLEFCKPKERVDAPSFGHGAGMLLKPEIVAKAIDEQEAKHGKALKIFFSPAGKKPTPLFLQNLANKAKEYGHLLLACARYEGMDARVEEEYADEVISIGDFVTMGGDLPAMVFLEGLLRFIPDVVGKQESVEQDSFSGAFVDYPEYTHPVDWRGKLVPDVVRSGNHAELQAWRKAEAAKRTVVSHFDWVRSYPKLTKQDIDLARKYIPNHYVTVLHSEVLLKGGLVGNTSVTSLDIHDIARSCATYGIKNYFLASRLEDQKKIVRTLLDFWETGYGADYNVHRHEAVRHIELKNDLQEVVEAIKEKEGKEPILVATSAKDFGPIKSITYNDQAKVWSQDRPVLLVFGTGHGLSPEVMDRCDYFLGPVLGFSEFNHLSVRSAVAIILDRWLGINKAQS